MVETVLAVHIAAGGLALVFGYTALFAAKGATVHRRSGQLFVAAMVVMLLGALVVGFARDKHNGVGITFSLYLILTALLTVREPVPGARWLERIGLMVALGTTVFCTMAGLRAVAPGGQRDDVFAPVLFLFAVVALCATVGDVRVIRGGPRTGSARVARHLWRMCYAFFVASGSFFLGQADELPAFLRIWPLLTLLAVLPLLMMVYWLWRVRVRRRLQGLVLSALPGAA